MNRQELVKYFEKINLTQRLSLSGFQNDDTPLSGLENCFLQVVMFGLYRNRSVYQYVMNSNPGNNTPLFHLRNLFVEMSNNHLGSYNLRRVMDAFRLGNVAPLAGGYANLAYRTIVETIRTYGFNGRTAFGTYRNRCDQRYHNLGRNHMTADVGIRFEGLGNLTASFNNYFTRTSPTTVQCWFQNCPNQRNTSTNYWRNSLLPDILGVETGLGSVGAVSLPLVLTLPSENSWLNSERQLVPIFVLNAGNKARSAHSRPMVIDAVNGLLCKVDYDNNQDRVVTEIPYSNTTVFTEDIDFVFYNKVYP